MRSATPKHLHPILGRRMVDWIVEAARPLAPEPLVVVASPDTATEFAGLTVAVQERPLGTGDAVRSAREALAGADEVLILSGDTPLLTTELLEALIETHRCGGRRRDRSLVRPGRHSQLRPDRPRRRRRPRVDRRGGRRDARAARDRRGELVDLRLPGRSALAGARPAAARQRAGRAVPDRRRPRSRRRRAPRSPSTSRPMPGETEGVNTRVELAAAAAALRDRINTAHMLAGVTISTPQSTWIEPTVTLEADTVVHPFTLLRGDDERRRRRRDRPSRGRRRCARSERGRSSGRSVTFARERCSGRGRRRARSWSSRTRGWTRARRFPI